MKISLKAARIDAGYTQKEAAKELGISKGTLASYEKYRTSPDISFSYRIAALYARDINEIAWKKENAGLFLPSNRALSVTEQKSEAAS